MARGHDVDGQAGGESRRAESRLDSPQGETPEVSMDGKDEEAEEAVEEEVESEAVEEAEDSDDVVGSPLLTSKLPVFEEPAQDDRWEKAPHWIREAYQALLMAYRLAASEADELRRITALFPEYIEDVPTDASPADIIEAVLDEHSDLLVVVDQVQAILSGLQVTLEDVDSSVVVGVGSLRNEYVRLVRMIEAAGVQAQQTPGGIPQAAMDRANTIAEPEPEVQVCPLCQGRATSCLACSGHGRVRVTA